MTIEMHEPKITSAVKQDHKTNETKLQRSEVVNFVNFRNFVTFQIKMKIFR